MPAGNQRTAYRRNSVAVASSVLIAIVCIYRVLTFTPQALDSSGTLRPILFRYFNWFAHFFASPEKAQHAWEAGCNVVLLIPAVLALWNYFFRRSRGGGGSWVAKVACSRLAFFIGIAVCLGVCRLPFLLAGEINPDETFFIAAAEKLCKDPVFFRAVDFVSSGPLNVYPLMIPAVFGLSPDYTSTRLIALLLILGSIYLTYRTLALLMDDAAARIAVLPAAGAFAVLRLGDFVPYTSEHISFLLLSLAVYICVKVFHRPQPHTWNVVGLGLLTACAFLAKMQAVPLLVCVAAVALAYLYSGGHSGRWWRPAVLFVAGVAPLLLVNALVCILAGVWHDFWMEYIVGNYYYVAAHRVRSAVVPHFAQFMLGVTEIRWLIMALLGISAAFAWQLWRRRSAAGWAILPEMAAVGVGVAMGVNWLWRTAGGATASNPIMIALLILPGLLVLLHGKRFSKQGPVQWFGILAGMMLPLAVAVAYTPHRPYAHYLLFLIIPLALAAAWTMAAVCDGARDTRWPFLLVFTMVTLACLISGLEPPGVATFASLPATVAVPEGKLIDALIPAAGRMVVWGWDARPYVGSGRVSGLKDMFSAQLFLTNGAVRSYYRETYLRGLQRYRPELFIDATATSSIQAFRDAKLFGLEVIPEIDSYIQSNYVHILDAYGQKFYGRRDLAGKVFPRYPFPQSSLTAMWRPGDAPPSPWQARVDVRPGWIEVTPLSDDPQLLFDLGPELGRYRTLIVRARFEKADRIDAFFGRQVDGRGVNAIVPQPDEWLDVYLNISQNPFWKDEHGTRLRFDPVSSVGPGANVRIAGIWGSPEGAPAGWPEVQFYEAPPILNQRIE